MSRKIFSQQTDEDGNLLYSNQIIPDVYESRTFVFSQQRQSGNVAVFANQVYIVEVLLKSSLSSRSVLKAKIVLDDLQISSSLASNSVINAHISFSEQTLLTTLKSYGSVSARLVANDSRLLSSLNSKSALLANLSYVQLVDVRASLNSRSNIFARLSFSGGSNIPKNIRMNAVPIDSDSVQLTRYRGDTYSDVFAVFNNTTGEPVDVTGCIFKMSVAKLNSCDPLPDVQYTLIGTLDDAEGGKVSFAPREDQANLVGFYHYDVEMDDGKGVVRTLISSSYVYKQDITP